MCLKCLESGQQRSGADTLPCCYVVLPAPPAPTAPTTSYQRITICCCSSTTIWFKSFFWVFVELFLADLYLSAVAAQLFSQAFYQLLILLMKILLRIQPINKWLIFTWVLLKSCLYIQTICVSSISINSFESRFTIQTTYLHHINTIQCVAQQMIHPHVLVLSAPSHLPYPVNSGSKI